MALFGALNFIMLQYKFETMIQQSGGPGRTVLHFNASVSRKREMRVYSSLLPLQEYNFILDQYIVLINRLCLLLHICCFKLDLDQCKSGGNSNSEERATMS
jgi:hypothetical protein